jgi:hypothetical protein
MELAIALIICGDVLYLREALFCFLFSFFFLLHTFPKQTPRL